MKNILLLFIALCFVSIASAQNIAKPIVVPVNKGASPVPKATYYCCMFCDFTAAKDANCPVHAKPLIRVGSYFCPFACGYKSDTNGKCPKNHCDLQLMKMKFATATKK